MIPVAVWTRTREAAEVVALALGRGGWPVVDHRALGELLGRIHAGAPLVLVIGPTLTPDEVDALADAMRGRPVAAVLLEDALAPLPPNAAAAFAGLPALRIPVRVGPLRRAVTEAAARTDALHTQAAAAPVD